jgi:hypothetical protein
MWSRMRSCRMQRATGDRRQQRDSRQAHQRRLVGSRRIGHRDQVGHQVAAPLHHGFSLRPCDIHALRRARGRCTFRAGNRRRSTRRAPAGRGAWFARAVPAASRGSAAHESARARFARRPLSPSRRPGELSVARCFRHVGVRTSLRSQVGRAGRGGDAGKFRAGEERLRSEAGTWREKSLAGVHDPDKAAPCAVGISRPRAGQGHARPEAPRLATRRHARRTRRRDASASRQ